MTDETAVTMDVIDAGGVPSPDVGPGHGGWHVALLAPPWYPVPPRGYGGVESVVALLVQELRARGHHVTLIAAEGSADATVRAPAGMGSLLGRGEERLRELAYAARVLATLREIGRVDVIHDHVGFATLFGCLQAGTAPVVHTVHGVVREPEAAFYSALGQQLNLIAISRNQRTLAPRLPWIGTVPNAVALEHLVVGSRDDKEPYLVCLARICPDKGQHIAIEVARRTGFRLVLAGKVERTAAATRYYEREIVPALDGTRVVHLDNVAGMEKAQLLARATALLAPIQWDEPFGLSVVEAMASGTPAISIARGAAPELIDDGRTGFLVGDAEEMITAVRRVSEIDTAYCAAVARARFSPAGMADGYLDLYAKAQSMSARGREHARGELATLSLSDRRELVPGRRSLDDFELPSEAVDADVA